ncbi:aspartate/glutamate racemase family protein [Saccharicrinis sp. FJH54]|uniref:aspartate/glutamate racemase family protein n=1 Tax=Saccharicrinis sp. FJH54 TaxID=3344665 RepID=UPI0035D4EEDF
MKTVVAIHTATTMVEPTKALFAEYLPDVRLINIADDSLIQDVIRANEVPTAVKKRLVSYYNAALDAGADVIFNTCSSVGDVAILARDLLPVPLVKIDDAMAEKAVRKYNKIGVLATLPTTLAPTARLLQKFSDELGKPVQIEKGLAEGAFQQLMEGNVDAHNAKILETAVALAEKVDAFVLAQGSMAKMQDEIIKQTGKDVLSSPLLGTLQVKSVIDSLT